MVDIATLLQFIFEGNWLGLIQAIYVSAFQSADLFWAFVILGVTSPIYIRTKSLVLLVILWILIGGSIIVAFPIAGGIAVFLMVFAIASVFFRVFIAIRS